MSKDEKKDKKEKKPRKPRQKGGYAIARVNRDAEAGEKICYRLTVLAEDFKTREAARTHLRQQITSETWASVNEEYGIIQIKDLGLKPKVETQVKITGV
jgi:uncharacterized alpha-E superfamily protein